ncbi:MAG TPA: EndoU domain-containing protein [Candidatus Babeliales bacterium]|nr:EndoU domain-containing protein [Candidatus Babeliales bacterium]
MVSGVAKAGWHLGKVLYEICDVAIACIVDKQAGFERVDQVVTNIERISIDLIHKIQDTPIKTLAREGTAIIVETSLTKKCLSAAHTMYKTAQQELAVAIKLAEQTNIMPAVPCSPGIIVAAEATGTAVAFKQEAEAIKAIEIAIAEAGDKAAKLPKNKLARKIDYLMYNEPEIVGLFVEFKDAFKINRNANLVGLRHIKITPEILKHIFGVEIIQEYKKSGIIKNITQGFHHNVKNQLSHLIHNAVIDKITGVMKADLHFLGQVKADKTFFPASWSRKKVLKKIQESLLNPTELPELQGSRWVWVGKTREGIEIRTVFEATGELVTSYPI